MTKLRAIELLCGVASAVLGFAAMGVLFFVPVTMETGPICYSTGACVSYTKHVSYFQQVGLAGTLPALIIFGVPLLGVAIFAVAHSRWPASGARLLLWICTILLWIATILGLLSVGRFMLPAGLAALIASILALVGVSDQPATM